MSGQQLPQGTEGADAQGLADNLRDMSLDGAAKGGRRSQPTDTIPASNSGPAPTGAVAPVSGSRSGPAPTATSAGPVAGSHEFETRLREQAVDISAQDRKELRTDTINYDAQRMIGHGSFGAVFLARVVETNEIVAIKKVLQDRRFKNRELQIMRQLAKQPHPYVVFLRHHFISKGSRNDDVYLNLVLEYIPETMHSVAKQYNRAREPFPMAAIRIYMYQLSRALAHIHGLGICHRDVKPQNLLVDPTRFVLKLCDFGSAKALVSGEPNIAYICSRYYRAPELIFGSTDYTTAVDVWSQGCVMAELILGTPMFPGASGVDQLVEIIKILGTPNRDELKSMNPNYQEFKFPQIKAQNWSNLFRSATPAEAKDLLQIMLTYTPTLRCKAIEACGHVFFNELRNPGATLPDGSPMPVTMFRLTQEELTLNPGMSHILVPPHVPPYDPSRPEQPNLTLSTSDTAVVSGGADFAGISVKGGHATHATHGTLPPASGAAPASTSTTAPAPSTLSTGRHASGPTGAP